jgi:1,4-dihydroxy-2-naphthoyl-CoA hydrolase
MPVSERVPTPTGFVEMIGLDIQEIGPDRVLAMLDVDERHHQPYGVVHGGVYCSIIETIASYGAVSWASQQGIIGSVGVSNATDFLRSHRTGRLRAVATPIHRGRTQQLWQVTIVRDDDGALVARGQVRLQNITDMAVLAGAAPKG